MSGDAPLVDGQRPTRSALTLDPTGSTRSALDINRPKPWGHGLADPASQPARLGDYHLEQRLGVGGMGEVFVARRGGHRVALKTLQNASSTNRLRFKNEFRALADVRHPNLVRLYTLGEAEGRSFFTMELLEDATPFVDWVRRGASPGERPDLGRLEAALGQLAMGLAEIHHYGYVHRDLKPSNVLVTAAGRVVILDFGLLSAANSEQRALTRDGQILGTPSYMAPEQVMGRSAGPPADLYAMGVMLYESLTGHLPIEGAAAEVLAKKLTRLDVDTELALIVPRWRELCGSLLRRRPQSRPNLTDVLAGLDHPRDYGGPRLVAPFVGRELELGHLREVRAALDEDGEPKIVHLRGPSGQGKSVLLQRFVAELRDEGCLVLDGRCRERESVPYKGIDAIVDALALHLRGLPEAERASLRPRSVAALARMFPVLDELWPNAKPEHLEPDELRGVAWAALREVLGGLTQRGPLALAIDDAQWSDLDSVRLLEALLDAPHPPTLLLVLVLRDGLGPRRALRAISASPILGASAARGIELGPLSQDDARTLVALLAAEPRETQRPNDPGRLALWTDSIVMRAKGSPMFITQLVLGSSDRDLDVQQLDRLVERRLARLDSTAHRLLAVISVANGPLTEALALALTPAADAMTLRHLQEQGLIVTSRLDGHGDARVETAHDRVREGMIASLDRTARSRLHTALGEALLAHDGEGDGLFRAVDQLDAGIVDYGPAALDDKRRLQLAELNRRAGQRARDTAAWVPASRYFGVAARLIEPWVPHARSGGKHHQLCVDVIFGEAQANHINGDERWFDRTDDLLGWSLSDVDYARILSVQLEGLIRRRRDAEAIQRGVAGLERLGVYVPRSPSVLRVIVAALRGWWTVRRLDRAALLAMPEVASERTRVAMHVMSHVSAASIKTKPALGLWLYSRNAVMTAKYGYHEHTLPALMSFGLVIIAIFDTARAIRLHDACVAAAEQRVVAARHMAVTRFVAQFILKSRVKPLRRVAATLEGLYRRLAEVGDRWLVESVASLALAAMTDSGHHHLPEIKKISERWRQQGPHSGDATGVTRATDSTVRFVEFLIDGPEPPSRPEDEDPRATERHDYEAIPKMAAIREMMTMLYAGDYARVLHVGRGIPLVMVKNSYLITLVALCSAIATAERLPSAPARQRRRMRGRMRRYRRILRHWTADVSESYAPMLDIVEAEYACVLGRFDQTIRYSERAVEAAAQSGMVWLAGLAAERLACRAERLGYPTIRQAALERARDFYETWGATALVDRIDAQLQGSHVGLGIVTSAAAP